MIKESTIREITTKAKGVGFEEVQFTNFEKFDFYSQNLKEFIKNKKYGEMLWLEDKAKIRSNPKNIWAEAKSAIVLGLNYAPDINPMQGLKKSDKAYISIYARRKDYHKVIKSKLKYLARDISNTQGMKVKVFVDTAPLMEKPLAELSGTGWFGKNTNIVSKKFGSWLFLGIILTNQKFLNTTKIKRNCGKCKSCIEVCPTKAFDSPYKLDATKCISYLTIEHKDQIPIEYRKHIGNRIFGCDDCLAICPWNSFAIEANDNKLDENSKINLMPLNTWLSLNDQKFREITSGTTIKRTGYIRMMRNCLIAAGNSKDISLIKKIKSFLNSEYDMLRGASVWALKQLLTSNDFKNLKKKHLNNEKSIEVKTEWR